MSSTQKLHLEIYINTPLLVLVLVLGSYVWARLVYVETFSLGEEISDLVDVDMPSPGGGGQVTDPRD